MNNYAEWYGPSVKPLKVDAMYPPKKYLIRSFVYLAAILCASASAVMGQGASLSQNIQGTQGTEALANKPYKLIYDQPAPHDADGWKTRSLPIGNGYFGVSVFGGLGNELWQFTDKSLFIQRAEKGGWNWLNLTPMCELQLDFGHAAEAVSQYSQELDLNRAVTTVAYEVGDVRYQRESFASYPDRVFVSRLSASSPGKLSFRLKGVNPYPGEYRTGSVSADATRMVLRGKTLPYHTEYEVRVQLKLEGGSSSTEGDDIVVENADEVMVIVTLATNYRLDPQVYNTDELSEKLAGFSIPVEMLDAKMQHAASSSWEDLLAAHLNDYQPLFNASKLDLGGSISTMTTDKLKRGGHPASDQRYFEELSYQYGRYLLIASSRKGTLPANLVGTWNGLEFASWTGGFWANINVQMNYWPAFVTGLETTFSPYYELFATMFEKNQVMAAETLSLWDRPVVNDGWTVGTGNTPYLVAPLGWHSGYGNGPFLLIEMWNWYQFTQDEAVLEKVWPFLIASSRFAANAVSEHDGLWLFDKSWSPEQKFRDDEAGKGYISFRGTAYDQQMLYENYSMTLEAAEILGKTDPILETIKKQLPYLDPVIIGESGQVKEYRQESSYGEFGDPGHRHISHMVGLYPGSLINQKEEWEEAAKVSLNLRGDRSTGWGLAHRLNCWARLKDGNRAYSIYASTIASRSFDNLWNAHPGVFQIDGNSGRTAGLAEMLIQSHEGYINVLPAMPDAWPEGSFDGLWARGAFRLSATWEASSNLSPIVSDVKIVSEKGRPCRLFSRWIKDWEIREASSGALVPTENTNGIVSFPTEVGGVYHAKPIAGPIPDPEPNTLGKID
jgi:hypothetical protein